MVFLFIFVSVGMSSSKSQSNQPDRSGVVEHAPYVSPSAVGELHTREFAKRDRDGGGDRMES